SSAPRASGARVRRGAEGRPCRSASSERLWNGKRETGNGDQRPGAGGQGNWELETGNETECLANGDVVRQASGGSGNGLRWDRCGLTACAQITARASRAGRAGRAPGWAAGGR